MFPLFIFAAWQLLLRKRNILKKIRKALSQSTPVPFPESDGSDFLFQPQTIEPEVEFAENFTQLLGIFSYCVDEQELALQIATLVKNKQWDKLYCVEDSIKKSLSLQGVHPKLAYRFSLLQRKFNPLRIFSCTYWQHHYEQCTN